MNPTHGEVPFHCTIDTRGFLPSLCLLRPNLGKSTTLCAHASG